MITKTPCEGLFDRTKTILEQKAYKNLQQYDFGTYKVKHNKEIEKILLLSLPKVKINNTVLDITEQDIKEYVNYAKCLNGIHAEFQPGVFLEQNSYEASFSKKGYYQSELEFIVNLFISHNNIHAFSDGNKRTALNIFIDFLYKYTTFYINDILIIQDAQILYLQKEIDEEKFRHIIFFEVKKRMFNTNIKCNLERLIRRGDIDESNNHPISFGATQRRDSINLTDLEDGQFFRQQLRKPFFQRDTNQWTAARVEKLINTFLEDGLIPAIILWENLDGDIYIIDGAHRLSSLIAWVNSDYGKENELQDSHHQHIKEYMDTQIGNYDEIKRSSDDKYKFIKQIIAKGSIRVQWVSGDYKKAKESFIRINEQGVVISQDEKELIENDQLPISKLSRAVLSHGLGQKSRNQTESSKLIFEKFFIPYLSHQLNNYPLAGSLSADFVISRVYTAIKIIEENDNLEIDALQEKVIRILNLLQDDLNISQKFYFYGATKQYKANAFYGILCFILKMEKDEEMKTKFIKNRKMFEDFLAGNERHIQNIARKKRQAKNAYEEIGLYYELLLKGCSQNDINNKFLKSKFPYLDFENKKQQSKKEITLKNNYMEIISKIHRCSVCGGFIDGDENNKNESKIHNCCKIIQ